MKFRDNILKLTNKSLKENPSLFLIDLVISVNNVIKIYIDGDSGVKLNDCIKISRYLEKNLDREENDFSLEVSSVGVDRPLTIARQFKKNKGRVLEVINLKGDLMKGELTFSNKEKIGLRWKVRQPKPIGKGKITVEKSTEIEYKNIVEAKVVI